VPKNAVRKLHSQYGNFRGDHQRREIPWIPRRYSMAETVSRIRPVFASIAISSKVKSPPRRP